MEQLECIFPSVDRSLLLDAFESSAQCVDRTVCLLNDMGFSSEYSQTGPDKKCIDKKRHKGEATEEVCCLDEDGFESYSISTISVGRSSLLQGPISDAEKQAAKQTGNSLTVADEDLHKLKTIFPQVSSSLLKMLLDEAGGDLEAATSTILLTPMRDEVAGEAEKSFHRKDIDRVGVISEADMHRTSSRRDAGLMAAVRPSKRPRRATPDQSAIAQMRAIDLSLPAQSFLCGLNPAAVVESLRAALGDDAVSAACFAQMLAREQVHFADYAVLYHSYSLAAPLYEVQSVLARALFDLPAHFAPLPRLLARPYDARPSLDLLMADFRGMAGQDHSPEFRAVAISASCSLLGTGSEAPPPAVFRAGYSCSDLSFRAALEGVLRECGLDPAAVARVADDVAATAHRHGLPGEYGGGGRAGGAGYGANPQGASPPGQLLQIFVRRNLIDSLAYRALPMGVPAGDHAPLSVHLLGEVSDGTNLQAAAVFQSGRGRTAVPIGGIAEHSWTTPCGGQARLFAHPAVLTDPQKCCLYNYRAAPAWNGPGDGPGTRAAFVADLERALAPVLGCPVALRRALAGVQARV
jgi:hypothetical protein